jgi:hypothetical protein
VLFPVRREACESCVKALRLVGEYRSPWIPGTSVASTPLLYVAGLDRGPLRGIVLVAFPLGLLLRPRVLRFGPLFRSR